MRRAVVYVISITNIAPTSTVLCCVHPFLETCQTRNQFHPGALLVYLSSPQRVKVYASFVYLMADLDQMVAADVFVGTFSSNVGRLVLLLREAIGKERSSCISLDYDWHPNR